MLIKTSVVLKDLAGKDIMDGDQPFTLGKALGNIVAGAKEGGKMKLYVLGSKLFQDKSVDVDEADLGLIKRAVESSEIYGAVILGQVEMLLGEVKAPKSK